MDIANLVRTGLVVDIESDKHNLGGRVKGDQWSADSSRRYNSFSGVRLTSSSCPDCVVAGEVEPGDTVHIVWAEYSTGDSFSSHYGVVTIINAYKSYAKAKEAKERLTAVSGYDYSIQLELEDGSTYGYHVPWIGYFENLDKIHITSAIVQGED